MKKLLLCVLFIGLAMSPLVANGAMQPSINVDIEDKYITVVTYTSAGINAAIDALGSEGGEVYLPEGDYDCTTVITIDQNNTTLRGAGKGTRLLATNRFVYDTVTGTPAAGETLDGDTNNYTATVVQVDTTNKIVWYHSLSNAANYADDEVVSWSGGANTTVNGTPTEQNFDVISTDKTHTIVSDLCIYGGSGGGNTDFEIHTTGAYGKIRNCWLYESDAESIYTLGGDYLACLNNIISEPDKDAILNSNADNVIVSGNVIENCGESGVQMSACSYAFVTNNFITTTGNDGITVDARTIITGNQIRSATYNGIHVSGASWSIVSGNLVKDSATGYADIKINSSDKCTIIGNVIDGIGTTDYGIYLDEADYCVVEGNFSEDHDVAGIQEDSDCQGNTIWGNNNNQDTTRVVINGTLHEKLDEPISLADTAEYTMRDATSGHGYLVAGDGEAWAAFSWTTGGAVTLEDNNNCTTTNDNDTTFNIYDSGTAVILESQLGGTNNVSMNLQYND